MRPHILDELGFIQKLFVEWLLGYSCRLGVLHTQHRLPSCVSRTLCIKCNKLSRQVVYNNLHRLSSFVARAWSLLIVIHDCYSLVPNQKLWIWYPIFYIIYIMMFKQIKQDTCKKTSHIIVSEQQLHCSSINKQLIIADHYWLHRKYLHYTCN